MASEADIIQAELEAVQSQNEQLIEENSKLRRELHRLANDDRSKSTINVEAKLKAFQYENERDRMYEQLEKLKIKYNQLHVAFVGKVKRCKALEDVFNRQKTLNGLVMKSAIAQRENEQHVLMEKRRTEHRESAAVTTLEEQITKLKTELDDAYDIIDELEFELESIDILEMENQRLQEELKSYKKEKLRLRTGIVPPQAEIPDNDDCEAPPRYNALDDTLRYGTESLASSLAESIAGDMDPETMERNALTESLVHMAEAESNCLRRELLRSRLRRTVRGERPTSSDA
ncbi:uncharacterized protein LOC142225677 [Haematobia irritans]|uniref:uncharacterized protein LOC142225677 n=1 Tax=Haematobia irritans TaxID=7368 RepID=UPI003F507DC5